MLDASTFPADTLVSFQQYTPLSVRPGARDLEQQVNLVPAHNTIGLWSWGERDSHLATGATSVVLTDGAPPDGEDQAPQRTLELRAGDVIILEQTEDPLTLGQRTCRPGAAPGRPPDRHAPPDR